MYTAQRLINGTKLTPEILLKNGWQQEKVFDKTFYTEPEVKDRDKVWVHFEHHYYRVFHGPDRTFIALEVSVEWLELYKLLLDKYQHYEAPEEILDCRD